MKFALLGAVATLALVIANGCNSVKFTKNEGACTVDNPCLQPNGLYGFSQSLTFTTTKKVDILIVNDNSGSMSQEQASLANPFNGFINNLNTAGVDWQVAVTNTDVCPVAGGSCWTPKGITGAQGKFMGPADGSGRQPDYGNYILTPSTPDVVNTFSRTIQRGSEVGAGDERGIYAANLAIDLAKTSNSGFFRDNSELAVVILSDEDERTTGGNCSPPDATKPSVCDPGYFPMEPYDLPQTLMNKVVTTFGGKKSFLVHSIVIKPEDSACLAVQQSQGPFFTAHYGNTYSELSTLAKNRSVVGSICDSGDGSYANMIRNVTEAIQRLPETNEMVLNYIPVSAPIVSFNPASNAVPWTWNPGTNVITFSRRPADNTTVTASASYMASQQISYLKHTLKYNPKTFSLGFSSAQQSNGARD